MANTRFVYATFIRTTPEKLWAALTQPEFTRQYWFETHHETTWQPGTDWKLMIPDGRVADSGTVLECDPPKRLVLLWRNEFVPGMREEGDSICTIELTPQDYVVKLTVVHESERPNSKLIETLGSGWPIMLSSLKSFIETGEPLEATRHWPKGM